MRLSWHLLIGAVCAFLNNILIIGLVWRDFGYMAATFIAFTPVFLVGYFLHCFITYQTKPRFDSFVGYFVSMLGNYPLWFLALHVFIDIAKLPIECATPMTTVLLFFWNYMSAGWIFSKFRFHNGN